MQVPTDLVSRARAGDPESEDALLREVWPHAYRISFSILGREALALDAAQEAAAHVLTHLSSLRQPEAFPGWFYRIAVRAAYSVARDERRHGALGSVGAAPGPELRAQVPKDGDGTDLAEGTFPALPPPGYPADPMAAVDQALDLAKAVGHLREPVRTVFLLSYHAGLTSRDIGDILHIPAGTVRYRLAVAREVLSGLLGSPDHSSKASPTSAEGPDAAGLAMPSQGGTEP